MKTYFHKYTIFVLFLFLFSNFSFAQNINFPEPREKSILNDLNILVWNQPNTGKVSVKIRIHSGSAFDPQGKSGTMVLLGDILFPEDGIKDLFEEDLEGKLEIVNTYDYLQINASGKSDEFLTILETLAPAISNPAINKEMTAKVKTRHLEKLKELEIKPEYIADRAIAERLLGDFPYGRPLEGTTESIENIDFADLIFAEQRFFNADNATIAIIGDVNSDFAFKAVRRLFGGWKKGDQKVPSTFKLPEDPDHTPLIINVENSNKSEDRLAVHAVARNHKDYYATRIVSEIWNKQYCVSGTFNYQANLLRGVLSIENSKTVNGTIDDLPAYSGECSLFGIKDSINGKSAVANFTKQQFDEAKNKLISELKKNYSTTEKLADFWFDISTHKLNSVKAELAKLDKTTYADSQRVFNDLVGKFKNDKYASVSIVPIKETPKTDINNDNDPNDPER